MTLRFLKAILFLTALFAVIILAMRLFHNDDDNIRKLLMPPEGCAAPCFMNVRAGITDGDEAARLIAAHQWAQSSLFYMKSWNDMYARYVLWRWSGQQPAGIDVYRQGQMRIYNDQAVGMIVDTTLSLGEVWLALGATDKGTVSMAQSRADKQIMLVMVYPAQGLLVRVVIPKRLSPTALWASPVEIESSDADTLSYFAHYHLPAPAQLWSMR